MGWIYLALSVATEVIGTAAMKLSRGFTKIVPSILMLAFYGLSFAFLTLALKKIDVSIGYAIWAGIATALVGVVGILYFKEPVTIIKVVSIALVVLGVIGLTLADSHLGHTG
ncbi:MAG: multidrug efflux SMR transporter [Dehalococcoidia bacterium]|nr:multidrug efflux SMR transporter [Dehalococcoidia bacterium]